MLLSLEKYYPHVLTFMYSCNPSTNASHTSGTIVEILCFEILNRYIKLWYESPVAKNLKVTASCSLSVTDFL
jgi:hypothetical protein